MDEDRFSLYSFIKDILLGRTETKESKGASREKVKKLYDEISKRVALDIHEKEMLHGVLFFRDTVVREVMVPRTEVISVEENTHIDDIVRKIIDKGFSRIPVYRDRIDNVTGIVYAKDLFKYWWKRGDITAKEIMREPMFVPETKRIKDLLRDFRERKIHMAVVVDEYGGVSGIVTLEDLIEEIVGDIKDEYDRGEEEPVTKLEDGSYMVDPKIDLDEFNELFKTNLYDENCETLGGFIFSKLGRIPKKGEELEAGGMRIVVEKASPRKIERLRVFPAGEEG